VLHSYNIQSFLFYIFLKWGREQNVSSRRRDLLSRGSGTTQFLKVVVDAIVGLLDETTLVGGEDFSAAVFVQGVVDVVTAAGDGCGGDGGRLVDDVEANDGVTTASLEGLEVALAIAARVSALDEVERVLVVVGDVAAGSVSGVGSVLVALLLLLLCFDVLGVFGFFDGIEVLNLSGVSRVLFNESSEVVGVSGGEVASQGSEVI